MERSLYTWTIYLNHPNFPPTMYVAREWEIKLGEVALTDKEPLISPDIDSIRHELRRKGLIPVGKMEGDDVTIVETWI